MKRRLAALITAFLLLTAIAIIGGFSLFHRSNPDDAIASLTRHYSYDLVNWEIRNFPGKSLYIVGHLFDSSPSEAERQSILDRYFTLTREIATIEQRNDELVVARELAAKGDERGQLENEVEDILEGRVTQILKEAGLTISPPLFADIDLVFPPVDFEFDNPPKILVISSRDRIQLDRTFQLRHGLDVEEISGLEESVDATGVSSLVISVHGVATYPSVIPELSAYPSLVDTIIHEWIHQFLALHPLGRDFFRNSETRTLNETVANMAGAELAQTLLARYLSPEPPQRLEQTVSSFAFDFTKDMRALRVQVEQLLGLGEIEEAERLMETKRQFFQSQGVYIRKINQAYFAFHGSYADTPGSIDPIGPKLQALRQKAGSVGEFVRIAAQITSVDELDGALVRLEATTPPGSAPVGP